MPSSFAVAGLTTAALSHVSFVMKSGISCSHALSAKRPSYTDWSCRNVSSRLSRPSGAVSAGAASAPPARGSATPACALPASEPSCRNARQRFSKSGSASTAGAGPCPPPSWKNVSRATWKPVRGAAPSTSSDSSSVAPRLSYSGLISGCTASSEPSQPEARSQFSR